MLRIFTLIFSAFLLSACGGGGSSDSGQTGGTLPAGLFTGTADNGKDVAAVFLPSGKLYAIYSDAGGLAGALFGTVTMTAAYSFTVHGKDYEASTDTLEAATVTGTYRTHQDLNATVTETGGTGSLSLLYQTLPALTLADIAGTYNGDDGSVTVTTTITNTGGISTAAADGCTSSGHLSNSAINSVFLVSVTYNAAACGTYNGKTVSGIVVYDQTELRIYAVAHDAALSAGGTIWGELVP